MAFEDNRPKVDRLQLKLKGWPDLASWSSTDLQEELDDAISWIEDLCTTSFNGLELEERYDGNTTNALLMRVRPITSVVLLQVETPILGYIRTYTPEEVKTYRRQGFLKVFTYKLAVEQVIFNTLDYQAWGTIFPPLPQAVRTIVTYGYPQYDEDQVKTRLAPNVVVDGDVRDKREQNHVRQLRKAAVCHAAASILGEQAGLPAGYVQSVSFDGYSRSQNAAGLEAQVNRLMAERDEILKRRRRRFAIATIG